MRGAIGLLLLVGLPAGMGRAEVRPAGVFGDHMVLQRDRPVPVWGWAAAGEAVTVTLGNATATATTGADGKWLVRLPAQAAGGPLVMAICGPANAVRVQDVLVGEVWLCSGQSNMQFAVRSALNAEQEMRQAGCPGIRLLTVWPSPQMEQPLSDLASPVWRVCAPNSIGSFSAVGYFFGRELHRELEVPIGLINTSYGGTSIEAWISREELLADDSTAVFVNEWDQVKSDIPALEQDAAVKTRAWEEAVAQAQAEGKPVPAKPRFHPFLRPQARPSALFNTCLAPLIPFATRGVLWYQGEAGGEPYGTLLTALIADWRTRFGRADWPFCVGQLHNVGPAQTDPNEACPWAARREAQFRVAQTVPQVGLTVNIDLGLPHDTHYPNKQEVGRRMSLWALAQVYGQDRCYCGPVFRAARVAAGRMRLQFDHAEGGLVAKGEKLTGFTIAGEDRQFHWAEAALDGAAVVVASPDVPQPVAVRYGWAWNPPCNLYNQAGLPAMPFRTDSW